MRGGAERLDQLARAGTILGLLHGIPVGIKDIIDVAGWPTLAGSRLREHHMAASDAPVVAAPCAAGAIILGKTVTTEFACFDLPLTRNPWNLQHTPGGSSSGERGGGVAGHVRGRPRFANGWLHHPPRQLLRCCGVEADLGAVAQAWCRSADIWTMLV